MMEVKVGGKKQKIRINDEKKRRRIKERMSWECKKSNKRR